MLSIARYRDVYTTPALTKRLSIYQSIQAQSSAID